MDNNDKLIDFFKKNGFSIAICSTVAILLIATLYFSYKGFEEYEPNNVVKEDADKDNLEAVNKSDVKSYKETITETTTQKQAEALTTTTEKTTEQTTKKVLEKSTEQTTNNNVSKEEKDKEKDKDKKETNVFNMFDENQEMTWPVSGQIVMDFSTETAIYDKTLDQYRTNNSICISSPEGTDVKASSDGVVENIYTDSENGKTIVINHGNGWLSTYSQLQDNVNVAVGDVVDEGQFIGKIGKPSNYSVMLGSHLNFKVSKDNVYSDPKLVLEQLEE